MPEDEEIADEDENEDALSKPRTQTRFNDEDDEDEDDYDPTGEEIEEEYVSLEYLLVLSAILMGLSRQEIDAEDMETLDALLPHNAGERKTLADLIFAKLDSGEVSSAAVIQKVHQSTYLVRIAR
jgi:essential nuclear protein 1